jgi:glycosyltransferase involved in cell wall biosynthesis
MKDAVRSGETGTLVAARDVGLLASALADMIADEPGRRGMGERALALVRQEFSAEVEVSRFESLYGSLLEKRLH